MALFRACFVFKERKPERVLFKVAKKEPVVLRIEKGDFQPLKLTYKD